MQHRRSDQGDIRYSVSNIIVDMYDFVAVCFICADIIHVACQYCCHLRRHDMKACSASQWNRQGKKLRVPAVFNLSSEFRTILNEV